MHHRGFGGTRTPYKRLRSITGLNVCLLPWDRDLVKVLVYLSVTAGTS